MRLVGEAFRLANVAAVYLVHGTFFGRDAFGLLTSMARIAPRMADTLRAWNKQVIDSVARDYGNFTRDFAQTWEAAMTAPGQTPIPVRLFYWSSENNHLGRAEGAVQLLHELHAQTFSAGSRVLLVGHSHGGNVLALLTNLIASDRETRCAFFKAARSYYYFALLRRVDLPIWEQVERLVCDQDEVLPGIHFDMATLGTPVRYGWDTSGCDHLVHFINHRSVPGLPEDRAIFPQTPDQLWTAAYGDFVQQCGIAGTNLPPPIWAWRACDAEIRLGRLLQTEESLFDLLARLKRGVRVHADGQNLLVDYGLRDETPAQHLFGHAVYTRKDWLLFHAEQIAERMYGHSVN